MSLVLQEQGELQKCSRCDNADALENFQVGQMMITGKQYNQRVLQLRIPDILYHQDRRQAVGD